MSDSSILPERQLLFSPMLAATLGLEEAILLQHLQQILEQSRAHQRNSHSWYTIDRDLLLRTLPFWAVADLQRICRSLVDKGVVLVDSPPLDQSEQLVITLTTGPAQTHTSTPVSHTRVTGPRSAHPLPEHWQPSDDLLQLLKLNHGIPTQFALGQLEDFIFYWRERGESHHAWENKFRQQVLSSWRRQQQECAESFQRPDAPLTRDWRPNADAMEIMSRAGVDQGFIEQAIPEFILYWRERGAPPKELNSRFIQHIRIQWARYTSSLEHSTEPQRIPGNWQPSEDVYDILRMSHIDAEFARELLPEFIVYWQDSNQAHTSWNSKFLQHAKFHWAKRHKMEATDKAYGKQQEPGGTGRTRDRSLSEDLNDTSWAK
ncbi:MAG: DnaT-like ssDNA-binding domain-containing protein [Pseudomonadota bacterium]